MALVNVSQTHKKHMTDLEIDDKPFRAFKCNFQVSLIQLSNHSHSLLEDDLLRSKHVGVPLNIFMYFNEINTLD